MKRKRCYKCNMSFRIGTPKIYGAKHEAHKCSDCGAFFHSTGENQNGMYVAVPYYSGSDMSHNKERKTNDY